MFRDLWLPSNFEIRLGYKRPQLKQNKAKLVKAPHLVIGNSVCKFADLSLCVWGKKLGPIMARFTQGHKAEKALMSLRENATDRIKRLKSNPTQDSKTIIGALIPLFKKLLFPTVGKAAQVVHHTLTGTQRVVSVWGPPDDSSQQGRTPA